MNRFFILFMIFQIQVSCCRISQCPVLYCPVLLRSSDKRMSCCILWWRRGVAVECWTWDQEVACSSLSRAPRRKNSGQVSHTYVPLSSSSITWYRSKGSCLATEEQTKLWSVCGWQVKSCVIPCYTRAESDFSLLSCVAAYRLSIAVLRDGCWLSVCLDWNKGSLLLSLLLL